MAQEHGLMYAPMTCTNLSFALLPLLPDPVSAPYIDMQLTCHTMPVQPRQSPLNTTIWHKTKLMSKKLLVPWNSNAMMSLLGQPQPWGMSNRTLPQVSIVRILARDEPRVQEGSRQQQCQSGDNVCASDSHNCPGDVPPNIGRNEGQPDPCKPIRWKLGSKLTYRPCLFSKLCPRLLTLMILRFGEDPWKLSDTSHRQSQCIAV